MTKFMTILIACSLAFAGAVQAEQNKSKKMPVQKSNPVQKQQVTPKQQHAVPKARVQSPHTQHAPNPNNAKMQNRNISKQPLHTPSTVHSKKLPAVQSNHLPTVHSKKLPAVQSNHLPTVHSKKLPAVQSNKLPAVQADRNTARRVQSQHVNFHARPSTGVASVQFNQHYRIRGSENWHGPHYNVFRSYQPEWHDRSWWHSNHNHILLIGGGWYFWNAGYWFPAWGYDTSAAYYPYDGPIYVGANARPADQVIADVQSVLQEQGYYRGEVDGLLGPLTQSALAAYQRDQGLEATATIDEPTLNALGLA